MGYVRCSTSEQELGPVAQRTAIERYCKNHGIELVAVFEDQGISGALELDRRPGLLAALGALGEHRAGLLVVHKRDRLARDPMIAGMITRIVERGGAKVHSAEGASNGDAPEDVLLRGIIDVFASYERLVIKARTKAALSVKRARGERVGQVPYGFRLAGEGCRVEPHPDEQKIIDRIRALRARRMSFERIAAALNREAVPARGSRWHPTTVVRVLHRAA